MTHPTCETRDADPPLEWEDCTGMYYAEASVSAGDVVWPSLIAVEWPEPGTLTADDVRGMAAMLTRAADACDHSTAETRRSA